MKSNEPTIEEYIKTNKESGTDGEKDVVEKVKCPSCGRNLMLLPPNYPLCDVQCTGCQFRAQIKTNKSKPKNIIFGAGWDILDKTLKSGYLMPSLIANFVWTENGNERQEIRFYPFISKKALTKRDANIKSRSKVYKMFNYNLKDLPFMLVYKH
jgi:hypothetical protein